MTRLHGEHSPWKMDGLERGDELECAITPSAATAGARSGVPGATPGAIPVGVASSAHSSRSLASATTGSGREGGGTRALNAAKSATSVGLIVAPQPHIGP